MDSLLAYRMSLKEEWLDLFHAFVSGLQFSHPKQTPIGTWSLVSGFTAGIHLEFLIRLLISSSVLKNTYLSKLVTWILKLRDIFARPWRDLCLHGNL